MTLKDNLPKIALGAWAWGNDGTFGNEHKTEDLKPIYDKAMELGLNLWDTAYVYGMGKSEEVLGEFLRTSDREDYVISTKFTPQLAEMFEANEVTAMYENSAKILGVEDIDIFWIHNPVGAPDWTKKLVETAKEHDIKMIGVSNHNLAEIKEANEILKEAGLKLGAVQTTTAYLTVHQKIPESWNTVKRMISYFSHIWYWSKVHCPVNMILKIHSLKGQTGQMHMAEVLLKLKS